MNDHYSTVIQILLAFRERKPADCLLIGTLSKVVGVGIDGSQWSAWPITGEAAAKNEAPYTPIHLTFQTGYESLMRALPEAGYSRLKFHPETWAPDRHDESTPESSETSAEEEPD